MTNIHGTSTCPILGTKECLLEKSGNCPCEQTAKLLGKKWMILMLRELLARPRRFNQILKSLEGISPGILSARLNELEGMGIAKRKVYDETPVKVEYSLTEKGRGLKDALVCMSEWWTKWNA